MMRTLLISPMVLACAACVPASPAVQQSSGPVRVSNGGQPFAMWDGAVARRAADELCDGKVRTSIYDRFDRTTGAWVYPEGCA